MRRDEVVQTAPPCSLFGVRLLAVRVLFGITVGIVLSSPTAAHALGAGRFAPGVGRDRSTVAREAALDKHDRASQSNRPRVSELKSTLGKTLKETDLEFTVGLRVFSPTLSLAGAVLGQRVSAGVFAQFYTGKNKGPRFNVGGSIASPFGIALASKAGGFGLGLQLPFSFLPIGAIVDQKGWRGWLGYQGVGALEIGDFGQRGPYLGGQLGVPVAYFPPLALAAVGRLYVYNPALKVITSKAEPVVKRIRVVTALPGKAITAIRGKGQTEEGSGSSNDLQPPL